MSRPPSGPSSEVASACASANSVDPVASSSSSSSQSVSTKWRKLVKMEYSRLRQQRKFRHQDDMRKAWTTNRRLITSRKEEADGEAAASEPRAKAVW